jgi:phosphatidylinositol glycan class O
LYALSAGTWDNQQIGANDCTQQNDLEAWMRRYAEALCINCWQVKRYIDRYSATSVIGFRAEDLNHVADLYSKAQANWSSVLRSTCPVETSSQDELKECANKECTSSALRLQIDAYSDFLESFAKLARSAWTEFDLWLMGIGLSVMILSVSTQACMLVKLNIDQISEKERASSSFIPKNFFAFALVAIRAASFLSNSYICEFVRYTNLIKYYKFIWCTCLFMHLFLVMQWQKVELQTFFWPRVALPVCGTQPQKENSS